jgi:hypothetical protein
MLSTPIKPGARPQGGLPAIMLRLAWITLLGDEFASAHTGKTGLRHQTCNALAANAHAIGGQVDVNARCPIGAA